MPTLRAWCGLWEGGEGRALVYRYVWRDDLSDTFDESVRVLLPVAWNASQCVSYALLSPTRYKT